MSMLISQKLDNDASTLSAEAEHSDIKWHPTRDILAVTSYAQALGGYGGKAFYSTSARAEQRINCTEWHPTEPVLVVGWQSGIITLVDPLKRQENDQPVGQLNDVQVSSWDLDGQKLLAGDANGNYALFNVQKQFEKLKLERSFQINDEIPICCFAKRINKYSSTGSAKGQRPQTAKNDDELAKILAQNRKRHQELDSGGVSGNDLELNSAFQREMNTLVAFIVATDKAFIYIVRPDEEPQKLYSSDSPMKQVLAMPDRQYIVGISENLMFYQLFIEGNSVNDKIKVKLSGKREHFKILQVDVDTVAFCYGDREIRIWDLQKEDSAVFRLAQDKGYTTTEQICHLSHSPKKDSVSGATLDGRIANWKRHRESFDLAIDQQFRLQAPVNLGATIKHFAWSKTSPTLAINSGNMVQIFRSQDIVFSMDNEYGIIQLGPQNISLVHVAEPIESQDVHFDYILAGFHIRGKHFITWDEEQIYVNLIQNEEHTPLEVQQLNATAANITKALIHNQQIYAIEKGQLCSRTLQGTVRKTLSFREIEGEVCVLDSNSKWLVVGSTHAYICIYNMEDNLRQTYHSSQLTSVQDFDRFATIRVNSQGNRVSFTVLKKNDETDERLYVWDAEADSLNYFSFAEGLTDQQKYENQMQLEDRQKTALPGGRPKTTTRQDSNERPKTAAARKIERDQSRYRMPQHLPGNLFWDQNDARFLCCEAHHINAEGSANLLLTLFVTEGGIQIQDLQPKPVKADALMWLNIPFVYYLKNIEVDEEDDINVERSISRLMLRRTLREFVGISPSDRPAIEAMVNFSYYLCIEQMDNAFKAINFIKNDTVWEQMARMCVKTRRTDVALVCLGHMRKASAASAIRDCVQRNDPIDLQAACLAIQLDMLEEAQTIYLQAKRYDLLNRLYQSQNKWTEAFEVAVKHDRIHLRNTHYNFAKYLESIGEIEKAIENFEKSQTHQFDIPRMLADEPKAIDLYVKRKRDRVLYRWWARYLESIGDMEGAKNYYKYADDYLSVIRILCYDGRIEEAIEAIKRSDDRAAAFHLARHFEANGNYEQAVTFFTKASSYNTAIRLAREHEMNDKLASLALMAGGTELVDTAKYYEEREGHADKAVMLYHKVGMIGRALDLAFKTEQLSALDLIALIRKFYNELHSFSSNNQQDRTAVLLLAYAKKFQEAVVLCKDKSVVITEEIANLLTPPKTDPNRKQLLEDIARCCLQQGNYHFAAKKFTQAGNKIEAMKALLRSGDTPKIILFANTAKSKDIFRMAGNYLQTLNWREDASLMRQIENCYMKANAMDSLALFYQACAQLEIDDYHDYEKAITAYNEAMRCWSKRAEKEGDLDMKISAKQDALKATINKIKEYLTAKELYDSDPGAGLQKIMSMAEESKIDESVRLHDIYTFLILHNFKRKNFKKAYQLLQQYQTKKTSVNITEVISSPVLDQICDEVGAPRVTPKQEELAGNEEDTIEFSHAMRRRMSSVGSFSDDG
ncbi:hypothetical protein M3Y97_00588900 [Aphelenchoides bicaudatus]|nr:hypothetical protein M3Y97_00588900 [Aphelenchoides bicaudatus]